jgi:hypothetical protein
MRSDRKWQNGLTKKNSKSDEEAGGITRYDRNVAREIQEAYPLFDETGKVTVIGRESTPKEFEG